MYIDLRRPHEHGTEQLTTLAPSSQGAPHQNLPHISSKAKKTDVQKQKLNQLPPPYHCKALCNCNENFSCIYSHREEKKNANKREFEQKRI